MVSSMNVGGVEKSLLSLLSVIPKDKYNITVLTLEKSGDFLNKIPNWVKIEEASWFKSIKPIIMQAPQDTIKEYLNNKEYVNIMMFMYSYFISKYFNNRYLYYKNVLRSVPQDIRTYDVAISYAGPTDIIDSYIIEKVKAKKKISWVHFDISKHKINKKLYTKLYSKFDKIFVVSKEAKEKLDNLIPIASKKSEVFLNIISEKIINEISKEDIEFDDDFKGIKIVTVGRLSKEKGQDIGIKVLDRLKKDGYNIRWYCIGEGKERREYEKLIEERNLYNDFILLGSRTNPYPYIKKSDIYVQTSRHEGYCITLAEAKCLNKPIVTTNFTGAQEQIKDGVTGMIANDEDELYTKIKEIIDNKSELERLRNNLSNIKVDTVNEVEKLFSYIE